MKHRKKRNFVSVALPRGHKQITAFTQYNCIAIVQSRVFVFCSKWGFYLLPANSLTCSKLAPVARGCIAGIEWWILTWDKLRYSLSQILNCTNPRWAIINCCWCLVLYSMDHRPSDTKFTNCYNCIKVKR